MSGCLACGRNDAVLTRGWEGRLGLASTDRLWRCPGCGLAWLERPQTAAAPSYEDTYFNDYAEHEMPGGINGVPPHVVERLDDLKKLLGRPGTFLDIGCGYGNVLQAAQDAGWTAQGLDVSRWSAEHVRRTRGIEVTVGDVFSVDFKTGAFGTIHLSHSLEHMPDPRAALTRIGQWLGPDDVVVIEVPNQLDELYAAVRWMLMRRYVPPPVANSHEFFFTSRSLRLMLEATGYRVITLRTERRNVDHDSRLPLGRLVKRVLFDAERRLLRGPNIVAWARRR
jgi:SAM-dependent methyltransferase